MIRNNSHPNRNYSPGTLRCMVSSVLAFMLPQFQWTNSKNAECMVSLVLAFMPPQFRWTNSKNAECMVSSVLAFMPPQFQGYLQRLLQGCPHCVQSSHQRRLKGPSLLHFPPTLTFTHLTALATLFVHAYYCHDHH